MNTFEVNNSGVFSRCTGCTLLICNLKHLQHCTGSAYPRSCSQHKHLSRQWIASFHWTTCFEKFLCSSNHLIHGIEKTETKQSCDIGLRPPHQSHLSIVKMAIFIWPLFIYFSVFDDSPDYPFPMVADVSFGVRTGAWLYRSYNTPFLKIKQQEEFSYLCCINPTLCQRLHL